MLVACQECLGDGKLEANQPETCKRLPGLWVICVLAGALGTIWLHLVFLAILTGGKAISGLVALIFYGFAFGLWVRSNVARIVVMVLMATSFVSTVIMWGLGGSCGWGTWKVILSMSIALAIFKVPTDFEYFPLAHLAPGS